MPFIKDIYKNSAFAHQSSPGYVLTFVRWSNRDTINYDTNPQDVRQPMVVINDAVSVQVTEAKGSVTGSANIVLKAGDINYATALAPGDYVFVNLLNNQQEAMRVADKALAQRPINEYTDGFKGLYKIQKVRRVINVSPETGAKSYQFIIHAFSFTEYNSTIYYNPTAQAAFRESQALFLAQFAEVWSTISTEKNNNSNIQDILIKLVKLIIGVGLNSKDEFSIPISANAQFVVPQSVGNLMGVQGAKTVPDIYRFVFGIWKDTLSSSENLTPGQGFNPSIEVIPGNVSYLATKGADSKLKGWKILAAEEFNQRQIWSILTSYSNSAINEGYTSTRVGPDNRVYPTTIFRQKPFSSNQFSNPNSVNNEKNVQFDYTHTKFSELPRWRVSSDLIYSVDLGKDEAARVNFVQLYGRSVVINDNVNQAVQAQNIYFDQEDIKRHGMKPAVVTSNFDFPVDSSSVLNSKNWSWLLFDMLNAGQNRESGLIQCQGIEEPIAPGDNLEFDGSIYHIESVSHVMQIEPGTGKKIFRTNLSLSFGTSLESNKARPVYPQQQFTDSVTERKRDRSQAGILPGFSETQDLPYAEGNSRSRGEEVRPTKEATFTGNARTQTGPNRAGTVDFKVSEKEKDLYKEKENGRVKKDGGGE